MSRVRTLGEKPIQVGLRCSHMDPYGSKAEEVSRRRSIVTTEAKTGVTRCQKIPWTPRRGKE